MKSLAKNTAFNILYEIANIVFPLAYSMYVARILFADGVGRVAFADTVVSYFLLFATLGLPTYSLREIAKVRNDKIAIAKLFTELFSLNALFTTLASIAFIVLIFANSSMRENLSLYICCGIPLFFNYFNIDWLYKGCEEYAYIALRSIVIKISMTFALFFFIRERSDYVLYAFIVSSATVGNYIFNVIHARKLVHFDFSRIDLKHHIKPVFIFFAGVALSSLYSGIDVFMLGVLCDTSYVGYYNYAQKIIGIVIAGCNAFAAAFLPRLSYYYEHDRLAFLQLVDMGTQVLFFIAVPAATGLFLLSPWIITLLYGKGFSESVLTVQIFSVLVIIRALGDLLCYQVVMSSGNERIRIPAVIIAVCVNVALNFILIRSFMHNGAAVASVFAEIVVNLFQYLYVRKNVGVRVNKKAVLQAVFSSVVMGGIILCLMYFCSDCIAFLPLAILVGGFSYLLVNLLIKNEVLLLVKNKIHISGVFRKMKKLKLILWSLYYRFYLAPFSYLRLCLNGKQRESLRTLCELKDKYKGKRCFVLGNGPSLTKEDVEKLRNEVTFASNRIYKMFAVTDWRPTYFGMIDEGVAKKEDCVELSKLDCAVKFYLSEGYWAFKKISGNSCYIHSWWQRKYLKKPGFSLDLCKGIYSIATVTYVLIQIAVWMGFTEIYLLGCDNSYRVERNKDGSIVTHNERKSYFGNQGKLETNVGSSWECNIAYEYAEKFSREHDFRIYNATRGGMLESFERKNLDEVLASWGESK